MSEVKVSLSAKDEIALLDRYGRRCSRETLVKRALAEVLRQQAENVPVFIAGAKREADETARLAAEAEAAKLPPEVEALLTRFRAGEKFVDLEGREVSSLLRAERDAPEPLIARFDADDTEWYPVSLDELKPVGSIT